MPQGAGPYRWTRDRNGEFRAEQNAEASARYGIDTTRKTVGDFAPLFRNLGQTSHYEVSFGGFSLDLKNYLKNKRGISDDFLRYDFGLLCNSANLPGSNFTTSTTRGNYTGIMENFAHTRDFGGSISLDFYVDKNYKAISVLESWMEYISSGYHQNDLAKQNDKNYFIRLQYPDLYKSNETRIYKFERDYESLMSYTFVGLFPMAINPIQVSYSESNILRMTCTFSYDRYIPGRTESISENDGTNNNRA